jgi:hypothetical protein
MMVEELVLVRYETKAIMMQWEHDALGINNLCD